MGEIMKLRVFGVVLLLMAVPTLVATRLAADGTEPVRIEQGLLAGATGVHPDVRVYKGIPYAAPPVGELRWKAPQPAAAWQGVRQATEFSPVCMQTPYPASAEIYQSKPQPLSEDCLYLNVWTAAKSAKDRLPVMVWIHGGGFTRGSGSSASYDGEILARKGVVVVTLNYRLGVFGFFAHPALTAESEDHASGNYALLDQIAALEWVKKNIRAFGGDAKCVTIFGESAGSWAVNALMASPRAKGLFHRAIGESGGSFASMKTLADAEKTGQDLAASLGATADVLKTLRAKPAEEILKASSEQTIRQVVDGSVLPEQIYTIFAQGKQNDVPLIVGFNADEGTALAPQGANIKKELFIAGALQRYAGLAEKFLKVYPAGTDEEAANSFYAAYRDGVFGWEMRTWARLQTKTGRHPAYFYYFTRRPPGPQREKLRAFHAADLAYVFGNFPWPFPWEETDHKLSHAITSYWTNFAKKGNPNGEGLRKWSAYEVKTDEMIEFGDEIGVGSPVNNVGLDFFDAYQESLRRNAVKPAATGSN
jgi:para-nitrobenzyl esterase